MRKNAAEHCGKGIVEAFYQVLYEAYDVALHNAQKRLIMNS